MFVQLRSAVLVFVVLTVVTGVAYPLLMTGVGQIMFSSQANGSMVEHDGKAVGSTLIGQLFDDPKYFAGRPSAAAYNGAASSGSNYGPTNPAQLELVVQRVEAAKAANPDQTGPVPVDLVTTSGSGLDPHISPAAAEHQAARVAKARGLDVQVVLALVAENTEGRTFGFLGEPRVNVLRLNVALNALQH